MAGPFLDRDRASRLMAASGLDALVISEPEVFTYATGVSPGVPALFRRAGAAFALIPADPALPAAAVIGDLYRDNFLARSPIQDVATHPIWIETVDVTRLLAGHGSNRPIDELVREAWSSSGRPADFARPATFDLQASLKALKGLLTGRGLASARLGFDLDFVPANDLAAIRAALPAAKIADGSPVLARLLVVKAPGEIERLRLGAALAEAGIAGAMAQVVPGQGPEELRALFREGVRQEALSRGVPQPGQTWEYIAIGPDPWSPAGRTAPGAAIKIDVGCVIDGYSSDSSRNFVVGSPSAHQRRVHEAIEAAFAAGLAEMKPGNPIAAIHRAATAEMHRQGFQGYSRGHFGHGIGYSIFSEQWPFIAADADVPLEPNMVLAFEIPFYITGVGAFNLEDQILVTATGHESMNHLPRGLVQVG
jgi:Xaa-Pro aminopeptidase